MKRICLCLCLLLMIVACDDENDGGRYPDVLTSFADVITDKSGTIEKMNDGDGISYSVSNASGGYKKDTLYRVVAQYRLVDESSIYLYNTTKTISPVPVPSNHIKGGFKTDSVRMQGIWLSAGYINIVLQIEGAGEAHSFHFGQDSISVSGEHRLVSLRLYHNRGEDAEYYTHRAYLSVPLKQYQLADGDTISMGVNLYGKGMKYYKFAYNQ
jgi:endonuclease YncB( thermonuclease family)